LDLGCRDAQRELDTLHAAFRRAMVLCIVDWILSNLFAKV